MRHEEYGNQVEITFQHTFETEFRTTVFAGAVLHRLLADAAETGLLGQYRNETVHLEGYDLVSGWKKKRYDPIGKRWPSKFFNWTARIVSGIRLHDFNCGLKAYRRRVVKAIEVYGEMHRYIPILAKQAGFKRIGEKVVEHRARKYGHSKFGMERMVKGYLDLITVSFLSRFGRSPMYFFGSLGTLMFLFGGCTTAWVIGVKLYKQCHDLPVRAVTDQPLFYLSLLAVVLGVQLFLAGFLGELIDRNAADRNKYLIEKTLDNQ